MKAILTILLMTFVAALCQAEEKPDELFIGKKADLEISEFMEKRWNKQTWLIENEVYPGSDYSYWKVNGTMWTVNIIPEPYLEKTIPKLKELDPKYRYLLRGIPVDQAYGAITFYTTSIIKQPDSTKPFKLDLTVGVIDVNYMNKNSLLRAMANKNITDYRFATPLSDEEAKASIEATILKLLDSGFEVTELDWNKNYNHYASSFAYGTISWPTKDPDIEWKWSLHSDDLAIVTHPNGDKYHLVKKVNEPKKPAKAVE